MGKFYDQSVGYLLYTSSISLHAEDGTATDSRLGSPYGEEVRSRRSW